MALKKIEGYRPKSQWFSKEGSFLIQTRKRGTTITLHCYKEKCPVKCFIKNGNDGPIQGEHNHIHEPWIPNRNALFQALKKRVARDHSSALNKIYKDEAARFPDAAPHLPYETVSHSMRKWRKDSKCPTKQITEQQKSPDREKDTRPAVYVVSQTSSPKADDTDDGMEIEHLDLDQLDEDESDYDNCSVNSELRYEQTDCEDDQEDQKYFQLKQLYDDESQDYRLDQDEEDSDHSYHNSSKRRRSNRSPVKVQPAVRSQSSRNQNHRRKRVSLSNAMKIGFIGGGRLAFALANGFISAGLAKPEEITASCHPSDTVSADAFKDLGATALFENKPVVERSEVVIVSVKPDVVGSVLREIKDLPASKNKLFISVAMGVSTATIERSLPKEARVIRVMPNTPALVKEGAAAISRGSRATADDATVATKLFKAVGTCDEVPEYQMDAVTALSGSGPAYIYMLIEALAEGGVRCGLPRDLSLRLASQTTLGAAAMLRNGGHPAQMKDNVTSPAGSTAEGTYHLEQNGFRAAIIGAVKAAADRCKVVNEQLNH